MLSTSKYLAVTVLLIVLLANIVYAIPQRQDPDMPSSDNVVIDKEELLEILDRLSDKLDDRVIDSYRVAIEDSLESGDYETANALLEKLREYINGTYALNNRVFDENTTKDLALVSSTTNITDRGVEIDVYKLLEEYAELINNEDLESIIKEFEENPSNIDPSEYTLIMETINKLVGNKTENISLEEIFSRSGEDMLSEITGFKPNFSIPKPVFNKPPLAPPANIPGIPVSSTNLVSPGFSIDLNMVSTITLLGVLVYLLVRYRSFIIEHIGLRARRFFAKTIIKVADIVKRIEDPVIRLYGRALKYLSLIGYKRYYYETPREFLRKLKEDEYRVVLEKLTTAYEERVYGYKSISTRKIDELTRLVNRMIHGKKHG